MEATRLFPSGFSSGENRKDVVKWEGKEIIVSMEMQRRVADLYVYDA